MRERRLVARWKLALFVAQHRKRLPHLAPAVSRRRAGASHLRRHGRTRDCFRPGWKVIFYFGGHPAERLVDPRCARRSADYVARLRLLAAILSGWQEALFLASLTGEPELCQRRTLGRKHGDWRARAAPPRV